MTLAEELWSDRKANLRYADPQGREYSAKGRITGLAGRAELTGVCEKTVCLPLTSIFV